LHDKGFLCIVITVGPKQVAKAVYDIWGFDGFYGSDYEVVDGIFAGEIIVYNDSTDKVKCLMDFCERQNIHPEDCIAVGDGSTDIPVFEYCGKSIAINALPEVKEKATHFIDTQDLADILCFIV
jgi:phosphoserine phosphatase